MRRETTTTVNRYPRAEEIASSVTHGLGAALAAAVLVWLVALSALRGEPVKTVSFALYGVSMFLLYSSSTLYHAFRTERLKRVFRLLDHASIYLLIAGTYTPFTLVTLRGRWGWTLFVLVWALALLGIAASPLLLKRSKLVGSLLYVAMGWLVVFAIKPLSASLPPGGMAWLAAGGLLYTSGVVFYVTKRIPFAHAIWHAFVLSGSVCHFIAVYRWVLPA